MEVVSKVAQVTGLIIIIWRHIETQSQGAEQFHRATADRHSSFPSLLPYADQEHLTAMLSVYFVELKGISAMQSEGIGRELLQPNPMSLSGALHWGPC